VRPITEQAPAPAVAPPPAAPGRVPPDREELRSVFGTFATGITVVATGREEPRGMTANSFTSVSLDPALVLVCVLRESALHAAVLENGEFTVSVLRSEQEPAARYFADRSRPRGEREFERIESWTAPQTGIPVLTGSAAWLECKLAAVYDGGDHSIFLGSVLGVGREPDCAALLYHRGRFRHLSAL
jgi:flavin reductase (DIM6/NTAB) family NADH-FMN oxidoreductase RutF